MKKLAVEIRPGTLRSVSLTLRSGESLDPKFREQLPEDIAAQMVFTDLHAGDTEAILTTDLNVRMKDGVVVSPVGGRVNVALPPDTNTTITSEAFGIVGTIAVRRNAGRKK